MFQRLKQTEKGLPEHVKRMALDREDIGQLIIVEMKIKD